MKYAAYLAPVAGIIIMLWEPVIRPEIESYLRKRRERNRSTPSD